MRMRTKALTVVIAMVTTFAILPTFGAAAAEPLDDGSYDVTVAESTYTVEVVDGIPAVDAGDAVFAFEFDEETGRVLDEFTVTVDDTTYDVAVADDGTVTVTEATDEDDGAGDGDTDDGDTDDGVDDDADGDDADGDEGDDTDEDVTGEDDEQGVTADEDDADDAADGEHGELVSTVAQCTLNGRVARDAGLPNQGYFVSAAARGEAVTFEVDGETLTADLTSLAGVEEFCALAADLVDAAGEGTTGEDGETTGTDEDGEAEGTDEDLVQPEDAEAEADSDEAGVKGRSSEAPGQAKKDR